MAAFLVLPHCPSPRKAIDDFPRFRLGSQRGLHGRFQGLPWDLCHQVGEFSYVSQIILTKQVLPRIV
jgi:hypothetical protein